MRKEFIIRVQMQNGSNRTIRAWGFSVNDSFQTLKKDDQSVKYLIDGKEA